MNCRELEINPTTIKTEFKIDKKTMALEAKFEWILSRKTEKTTQIWSSVNNPIYAMENPGWCLN